MTGVKRGIAHACHHVQTDAAAKPGEAPLHASLRPRAAENLPEAPRGLLPVTARDRLCPALLLLWSHRGSPCVARQDNFAKPARTWRVERLERSTLAPPLAAVPLRPGSQPLKFSMSTGASGLPTDAQPEQQVVLDAEPEQAKAQVSGGRKEATGAGGFVWE